MSGEAQVTVGKLRELLADEDPDLPVWLDVDGSCRPLHSVEVFADMLQLWDGPDPPSPTQIGTHR